MGLVAMLAVVALGLGQGLSGKTPTAAAANLVTCGATISVAGEYALAGDCASAGPVAITITASDVHLTLAGHTITGPTDCSSLNDIAANSFGSSVGILVGAFSNVHINGGTVGPGFAYGIRLNGTFGSQVNGMTVTGNCIFGIHLVNADGNQFNTNTVELTINVPEDDRCVEQAAPVEGAIGKVITSCSDPVFIHSDGYRLENSDGNVITSNDVLQNGAAHQNANGSHGDGIHLISSTINQIRSNNVANNSGHGVELDSESDDNVIRSNTVTDNGGDGILVLSDGNLIQGNTVTFSGFIGIRLEPGATGNTVKSNTSTNNPVHDLSDGNATCDANTWKANTFGTRNQTCIS